MSDSLANFDGEDSRQSLVLMVQFGSERDIDRGGWGLVQFFCEMGIIGRGSVTVPSRVWSGFRYRVGGQGVLCHLKMVGFGGNMWVLIVKVLSDIFGCCGGSRWELGFFKKVRDFLESDGMCGQQKHFWCRRGGPICGRST